MCIVHEQEVELYKKNLRENIFALIETLKQPYTTIMEMPAKVLVDLLKWKSQLEEEKAKLMKEKSASLNIKGRK